jgi:hypothetical protein
MIERCHVPAGLVCLWFLQQQRRLRPRREQSKFCECGGYAPLTLCRAPSDTGVEGPVVGLAYVCARCGRRWAAAIAAACGEVTR